MYRKNITKAAERLRLLGETGHFAEQKDIKTGVDNIDLSQYLMIPPLQTINYSAGGRETADTWVVTLRQNCFNSARNWKLRG